MNYETSNMTFKELHSAIECVGYSVASDLRNIDKDVSQLINIDNTMRAIISVIEACDGGESDARRAARQAGCTDYDTLSTVNRLINRLQSTTRRLELIQKHLHEKA